MAAAGWSMSAEEVHFIQVNFIETASVTIALSLHQTWWCGYGATSLLFMLVKLQTTSVLWLGGGGAGSP